MATRRKEGRRPGSVKLSRRYSRSPYKYYLCMREILERRQEDDGVILPLLLSARPETGESVDLTKTHYWNEDLSTSNAEDRLAEL